MNPTYEDIVKADSMRGGEIRKTPLLYSSTFSELTGAEIYLKAEFQQKTGSFKIRGAFYKINSLSIEEKKRGVVAASAGNHAQGVAFASALENIPCTIVMPKNASPQHIYLYNTRVDFLLLSIGKYIPPGFFQAFYIFFQNF